MAKQKFNKNDKFKKCSKKKGRLSDEAKAKLSEEVTEKMSHKSGWNHPSWYIPDENIRKTVGSFSFSNVLGVPILLGENAPIESISYAANQVESTVMSIQTFPYPGDDSVISYYAIPAISTAARKLYTAISAVNSKTTQYTAPTLSKAILCVGDLISMISHAQRAIGIAFTYNPRNRQLPKQLLAAMGFNPDSILDNLPLFRNQLNTIITMANNIRMPKDIAYFTKCWDMYANVYEDSDSAMAQYYVMSPVGYLMLDETNTPSDVTFTLFPSAMTYTQFLTILKNMVKALLDSTTLNYVFTDVINYTLKQGGDLVGFSYVPELYSILPVYDQTFLTQVRNMSWGYFDLSNYVISEDVLKNILVTTNIFSFITGTHTPARVAMNCGDSILELPFTDNPTPDDVIDAVAFKTILDNFEQTTSGQPYKFWETAIPDHPVYAVMMYYSDGSSSGTTGYLYEDQWSVATYAQYAQQFNGFKVAPLVYSVNTTTYAKQVMGDLNFFTVINLRQLRQLFDWYFLGLFDAEVKGVKPF